MGISKLIGLLGKDESVRVILRKLGHDGGPGSGNFGHAGRPGEVGGSSENGGSKSVGEGKSNQKSEWLQKQEKRKEIASKWPANRQAEYCFENGFATEEEAMKAMEDGTTQKLIDRYFDIMKKNGDPTPTKPVYRNNTNELHERVERGDNGGDFDECRKDIIMDRTGCNEEEAKEYLSQFWTWTGGRWTSASTEVLDRYVDSDGVAEGEIYRGLSFDEEKYNAFMNGLEPGAVIGMKGYNSSWTTSREEAINFSRGGERHVVIKCIKNKTSAPIAPFNHHGEDEVMAHSRAQWTVLGVIEGDRRTEITVIESEHRMSEEERNKKRILNDSLNDDMSLKDRINEQAKYMFVVSRDSVAADGGPGSGNFGHSGRPGKVGGSGPGGGGKQYRAYHPALGYFSSKTDWLNGLSGERQEYASKLVKAAQSKIPPTSEMKPEEYIMKNWPVEARAQFVDLVGEARSWKDRGWILSAKNLTSDEEFGLWQLGAALDNRFAAEGESVFTDEQIRNNDFDSYLGLMTPEEQEFYLDMKAKACGLPNSGKELSDYSKTFQKEIGMLKEATPPLTDEDNKTWIEFLTRQEKEDVQKSIGGAFGISMYDFSNSPDMNSFERDMVEKMTDHASDGESEEYISALSEYLVKKDKAVNANFFKSMANMAPYYSGGNDGVGRLDRYGSYAMMNLLKTANEDNGLSIEEHGDVLETNLLMNKDVPQDIRAAYLALKAVALGTPPEGIISTFGYRRKLESYVALKEEEKRKKVIAERKASRLKEYNEKKKDGVVVIQGDSFSESINSMRNESGSYTHEEVKKIGSRVSKELGKEVEKRKKRIEKLEEKIKEIDEQKNEEARKIRENPAGYTLSDIFALEQKYSKLKYPYNNQIREIKKEKPIVDLLKRIRKVGPSDPDAMKSHLPGRSKMKEYVSGAYQDYPQEWVDISMQKGSITTKKTQRGYYSVDGTIAISGDFDKECYETATHELGHRFEDVIPGIADAERELYDKRTAGEKEESLRKLTGVKYRSDEKTKKDKFIHPYIGKVYSDNTFEIVSMGFQYAVHNPEKLLQDPEYASFILGLLAVG